jgi:hypothetical protein
MSMSTTEKKLGMIENNSKVYRTLANTLWYAIQDQAFLHSTTIQIVAAARGDIVQVWQQCVVIVWQATGPFCPAPAQAPAVSLPTQS